MADSNEDLNLQEDLKDGPTRNRSCTDILCCLLFLVFWAVSIFIFTETFKNGDVTKIARPFDADGRLF
jgi:hypothetical protein